VVLKIECVSYVGLKMLLFSFSNLYERAFDLVNPIIGGYLNRTLTICLY
jgi:hypothetical protein